jgi:hypothetical protein
MSAELSDHGENKAQQTAADYEVHRVDDNGNEFVVATGLALEDAEQLAAMYEARAHKQMYMVRKGKP